MGSLVQLPQALSGHLTDRPGAMGIGRLTTAVRGLGTVSQQLSSVQVDGQNRLSYRNTFNDTECGSLWPSEDDCALW
jgi:hypothetical protein